MSARHEIAKRLGHANRYTLELAKWRGGWIESARPNQLWPSGEDWNVWLVLAGRGFGKTRIGAEEAGYLAAATPQQRIAVVGPTQNDVRSVCFEGESGLANKVPAYFISSYNASTLEMKLRNGSILVGKSAEKPDRLRGPQWHGAWCDELASWGASSAKNGRGGSHRLQDTWDNLLFGLRLGKRPRVIVTTTPRPLPFLRELAADPATRATRGTMFDNAANLAPTALAALKKIYEGTRRGRQELYGELLDDAEGVLFKSSLLDAARVRAIGMDEIIRIVVAIDPAITAEDSSDETGIIVAGITAEGHVYVLEDLSGKYDPREWARISLAAMERYTADAIVAEKNQGGDLVESNLRAVAGDRHFRFIGVHAKKGKYLRAEPISAYYEQGKVHHVGIFPKLESQMVTFAGFTGDTSPDRLDALVYAIGELMLGQSSYAFW